MRKIIFGVLAVSITLVVLSFRSEKGGEEKINWMSWEEAVILSEENPKRIFIDVYTEWCGWCKRMDKTTFSDKEVATFMNKNFYAVKLDAEQKEDIIFQNNTFKFLPDAGRRGVHELAKALLDGKMSYPSIVYMDEQFRRITISAGYKDAKGIMPELKYVGEGIYEKMTWQDYYQSLNLEK